MIKHWLPFLLARVPKPLFEVKERKEPEEPAKSKYPQEDKRDLSGKLRFCTFHKRMEPTENFGWVTSGGYTYQRRYCREGMALKRKEYAANNRRK